MNVTHGAKSRIFVHHLACLRIFLLKLGQRTFFTYLMRPVVDSFSRAFREH